MTQLFEEIIKADEELEMALGTENEQAAIMKVNGLMAKLAEQGLEDEFEQYACELNDNF